LTSSVFRLILVDLFAIVQDIVEHAAADAAVHAQHVAENVENEAREDDRFVMPDVNIKEAIEAVKDQGRQAVDGIENATQAMKHKWKGTGDEVAVKAKEKILERIKQVLLLLLFSRHEIYLTPKSMLGGLTRPERCWISFCYARYSCTGEKVRGQGRFWCRCSRFYYQ
jgi:hypothetical protein